MLYEARVAHRKNFIEAEEVERILSQTLDEFMKKHRPPSTNYIIVRKGTKLLNIIRAIAIGHPVMVVVVDEKRRPIGYITDRELLRIIARKPRHSYMVMGFNLGRIYIPIEQALNVPVEKIMERRPPILRLSDRVSDAVQLIRTYGAPHIIVVDDKGVVRGVISSHYLAETIIKSLLGEPHAVY